MGGPLECRHPGAVAVAPPGKGVPPGDSVCYIDAQRFSGSRGRSDRSASVKPATTCHRLPGLNFIATPYVYTFFRGSNERSSGLIRRRHERLICVRRVRGSGVGQGGRATIGGNRVNGRDQAHSRKRSPSRAPRRRLRACGQRILGSYDSAKTASRSWRTTSTPERLAALLKPSMPLRCLGQWQAARCAPARAGPDSRPTLPPWPHAGAHLARKGLKGPAAVPDLR